MSDPIEFLPPGTPVDLDNCAREPIHIPGSIQPHGGLLVARASDGVIVQTSANIEAILGPAPEAILGRSLAALVGDEAARHFVDAAPAGSSTTARPSRVLIDGRPFDAHSFRTGDVLVAVELEPGRGEPGDDLSAISRISSWSTGLRSAQSVDELVGFAARALRELTGYDRVWAYRFEPDGHGVVVAEECAPELESFLGLHFPEGDIPKQARDLYVRNGVRVIPDVAAETSPLVPVVNPETEAWLDLSGGSLRAVSPMHITYLRNMGVKASMSVSLVVDGQLWGLLSGHHYAGPRQVQLSVRGECELLGILTSLQLAAAAEVERARHGLELQRSVAVVTEALTTHDAFADGLVADRDALLALCGASGAIVSIGGTRTLIGDTPEGKDLDRLLAVLADRPDDLIATEAFTADHPEIDDLAATAAGVLAFPLSRGQVNWLVWLRPEHVHEVIWANRDKELVRRDPAGEMELGGRESFERWAEEVRGRSRPWAAAEVDAVRGLRSALGGLLVTRTDKLARMNAELERSNDELDAFAYAAAHDLREPVRGIEQFADFFLEDYGEILDDAGREQIQTIRRLTGRMEGLLTSLLDYAQIDQGVSARSAVHLPSIVDEVRELLAARIPADATIDVEDTTVQADPDGLRQLLLNLIWNAIKYTPASEAARVEVGTMWLSQAEGDTPRVTRSLIGDDEPVAVFVRDHGIGIAPEFHEQVFELFRRLHRREEYGGGSGAGLTLSRRIVQRHGGTIWVESTAGQGATFFFTLDIA